MNPEFPNLPTLPEPREPRQGEGVPGSDLTALQREACALSILEGLSHRQLALCVGTSARSIDRWVLTPAWRRYCSFLLEPAVTEARNTVRAYFSRIGPEVAQRVGELALGKGRKGRPTHPYMDKFCRLVLDTLMPRQPGSPSVSVEALQDGDRQGIRVIIGHDPRKPRPAWATEAEQAGGQRE
jgi:hypothetical protein